MKSTLEAWSSLQRQNANDMMESRDKEEKRFRKADKKAKKSKSEKEAKREAKKDAKVGEGHEGGIDSSDFYRYNEHFRCWLALSEKGTFDKLGSDKSRELFEEFCGLYNKRMLSDIFYVGDHMPMDIVEALGIKKTAAHSWNFKITQEDKESLSVMAESVHNDTISGNSGLWRERKRHDDFEPKSRPVPGRSGGAPRSWQARELQEDDARDMRQYQRKRNRDLMKERVEELVPRADRGSREAMLEKRREFRLAAVEADERKLDFDVIDDSYLMGGDDSLEAAKARLEMQKQRKKQKKENNEEIRQERMQELSLKFNEGGEVKARGWIS